MIRSWIPRSRSALMNPTNESQGSQAMQALADRGRICEQRGNVNETSGPDEDGACTALPRPEFRKDVRKKRSFWKKTGLVLLGVAVVGLFAGLFLPAFEQIHWVGGKDLDITFIVTDAENNLPLQGAKVNILHEDTSFSANRGKAPFQIAVDVRGVAKECCGHTMCFGTVGRKGWWRRIDTFCIHLPGWLIQIEAPGYTTCEPFYLDKREY